MKKPGFAKYASVIAAAAVFASWVVSNAYLDTAKGLRANMESILSFHRDHDQRRLMWNWFRNNERTLSSIDQKIGWLVTKPANDQELLYDRAWAKLPLLGIVSQEVTDLMIFTNELEKTTDGIPAKPKLGVTAKALGEKVRDLNGDLEKWGNEFHANVERIADGRRQSFHDLSPEQREKTIAAIDAYERRVFQRAESSTQLQNELWRLADEIVFSAKERAAQAAAQAQAAQTLSYFFFVAGTLLAIWAKYIEAKASSKEASSDDSEIETSS